MKYSNCLLIIAIKILVSNYVGVIECGLELNVQVLICTDYSIYKMHESIVSTNKWNLYSATSVESKQDSVISHIKAYYTEIVDQVNARYQDSFSGDSQINIKIDVAGFYIAMSPHDSLWTEKNIISDSGQNYDSKYVKINGDEALKDFNRWIEYKRNELAQFDHAYGVTAYDIVNKNDDVDYNGLAYIYGICKELYSGSIIEDKGAFESVRSFAHELAHNLGAEHDSTNKQSECDEWENYIMASKFLPYNQLNSWLFSNCSKEKMKEYLLSYENNYCLLNKFERDFIDDEEFKIYPGQIYDLHDQCRQLNGQFSSPCYEYESSFCENLFCHRNDSMSECVWVAPAAEGSDCGPHKWCQKGKCILKEEFVKRGEDINEETILDSNSGCKDCEIIDRVESKQTEKINDDSCEDILNGEFCQMAYMNEFCNEMFYWNGRNIAREWCRKNCNQCV